MGMQCLDSNDERFQHLGIVRDRTNGHVNVHGIPVTLGAGGPHVPNIERFCHHVVTDYDAALYRFIAVGLRLGHPLLIEGATDYGKTSAVDFLGAATNRGVYYANCHDMDPDLIIGTKTMREDTRSGFGWADGILTLAARYGGIALLDEYNFMRGETRARVHEFVDAILMGKGKITLLENDGEVFSVHDDFRLIVVQNPADNEFTDREILDPAQLSRFVYLKLPSHMPKEMKLARVEAFLSGNPYVAKQHFPEYIYREALSDDALRAIPGMRQIWEKYVEFEQTLSEMITERKLGADQVQPIYLAFQRDSLRLLSFVRHFYAGNINTVMERGLEYYYTNRFESDEDKEKIRAAMRLVRCDPPATVFRVAVDPSGVPTRTYTSAYEEANLPLLRQLMTHGIGAEDVALFLASTRSDEAMELFDLQGPSYSIFKVAGSDSEEAWEARGDALRKSPVPPLYIAHSMAGTRSPEKYQMLEEMREKLTTVDFARCLIALVGDDSDQAWQLRDSVVTTASKDDEMTTLRSCLVRSCAGLNSAKAKNLRKTAFETRVWRYDYGASLIGLEGRELKSEFNKIEKQIPKEAGSNTFWRNAMMIALSGRDDAEAWKLRESLLESGASVVFLAGSLDGIDSDRATTWRQSAIEKVTSEEEARYVAGGIFGDTILRALWALGKMRA